MTDLALFWDDEALSADVALVGGDLATDAGLRSAMLISIFTDRRARPDDVLPYENADRRGWWGDVAATEVDDEIGSRLWLLSREKRLSPVLDRARDYLIESLAWLLRDGVVGALDVEVEFGGQVAGRDRLHFAVYVSRPGGPTRQRFDFVWSNL